MHLSGNIMFLLVAALSGMAMAIQGSMNSALGKALGISQGIFSVHASATLMMLIILGSGLPKGGNWSNYTSLPWFYFLGGIIGVAITYGVVVSIPKLGASIATTAIIVGQVLTACLIDHFGLFGLERSPMNWLKLLGLVLVAIGSKLLLN